MAHIKSRKHANVLPSRLTPIAALALAALPAAVLAQQQAPAAPAEPAKAQVLPAVKAKAKTETENAFKADTASSPKFTQPLVDTPQTITVIKKEILQQQVATSLTEALRNTPGITLQLGENGNTQTGDSIFMRGFDTTNSIFVDGIRDLGSISRDTFNIEQLEVVKGPSGSDNGRGAASGYVNLSSKVAEREAFNNGSVTLGTSKRVRATADLNRPLELGIPGSALRLNVMAQDYGTPGRDEVKSKRFGFAPSLAFGVGTPTRVYLNYLYIDQHNRPDGGVSTYGLPGFGYATTDVARGPRVDSSNFYGSTGDFDDVTLHMFTSRIEHDFGGGTVLRNTTRLGSTEQNYVLTGVNGVILGTPPTTNPNALLVSRSRQGRHQTNHILTNQTNLNTEFETAGLKHSLSTGVEFSHEAQNQANAQTLTDTSRTGATLPTTPLSQQAANLYNPSTGDAFLLPPHRGGYTKGSTLGAAAYAFDTLKLSEQWLVNGGLRVEKFHTETNSATFNAASGTGTTPITAESLVQNPAAGLTDTLVSWKIGAVFKPAANGSIYATASTSYQPPGGANFALSNAAGNQANASSEPQKGSNLELGTKWDLFGNKVSATAAIYRSENENEIINDATTNNQPLAVGKRRVDGVELGMVGQLTREFNLSAGVAYMDPKIIRGTALNQGGVIVFSPKVTATAWGTYKLPVGLTIGGGVRYVDTVARSSNNNVTTGLLSTASYWVSDAMLAYDLSKNVSLQLNVYNVFDKEYVSTLNNGGSRYTPGQSRNALLTANFKF